LPSPTRPDRRNEPSYRSFLEDRGRPTSIRYCQRKGTRTHHRCVPRPPRYTICGFRKETIAGIHRYGRDEFDVPVRGEASIFVSSFFRGRPACWFPKIERCAKYRGQALGGAEQINILPDEPDIDSRGALSTDRHGVRPRDAPARAAGGQQWSLGARRWPPCAPPACVEFYQYSPALELRRGGSLGPLLRCGNGEGLRVHD
jgi:hypothetical protein